MTLHDELAGLAAKATQEELTDGGRYFSESLDDLTKCSHYETGNYQNRHDGELIETLWNNLPAILSALNAADEVKRLREALGTIAAGDVPISVSPDLAVRYEKFARAALKGSQQ